MAGAKTEAGTNRRRPIQNSQAKKVILSGPIIMGIMVDARDQALNFRLWKTSNSKLKLSIILGR